jgi:hypothetical protein
VNKAASLLAATAAVLLVTACSPPAVGTSPAESTPPAETAPPATAEPSESSAPAESPAAEGTPITITAGEEVLTAKLNDSQVSQDFAAMLPVTLPWFRNYGIEYITELSAPLTETGPFYTDVQPGDIVYYNPMDSITIIYEETGSVPTLTEMGEITSDLSVFRSLPDNVEMLVELG